jgi:protein phosphatase
VDLSPPEALMRAMVETNAEVHRRGQANSDFHNMGTTASVLVLLPQGALMAHIGDSRVYRLRNNRLQQLTRDHSLIWELRDQLAGNGDLAIPRNVITRSLGPNATVQVDIEGPLRIEPGDTFLLCTDGLTGRVSDEELAPVLRDLPPQEAAHLFIDLANLRGGPDNITAIVIKVIDAAVATDDAQPLTIGTKQYTVQPAIWVCLAVCILATLVLAFTNNPIPALVAAAGGVVALILGLLARHKTLRAGTALNEESKLGGGPYTETALGSSEQSTTLLGGITRELRASANDELRELDWSDFDMHCQQAQNAQNESNLADAMRSYARAIRYLMEQVKENQKRKASDSTIDL